MLTRPVQAIATAITALAMSACASTIGNVTDLQEVSFEIGSTHKSEVSDVLGFPASRDTESGLEYWGYRQKPELTGVIYALPTSSTTVTTYSATKPFSRRVIEASMSKVLPSLSTVRRMRT